MRKLRAHLPCLALAVLGATFTLRAQQEQALKPMPNDAAPAFEVATIKLADPAANQSGFQIRDRRILCLSESLQNMILFAYGLHAKEIAGGPDWLASDHYDVNGIPDLDGTPSLVQMRGMYQRLLADRFGLRLHQEQRELAVYTLSIDRAPKLTLSKGDPDGLPDSTGTQGHGQRSTRFTNMTMAEFTKDIAFFTDRPILDRTGIQGRYDFSLHWTLDSLQPPEPDAPPNLFTAVREQLGLKLEPVKAPAEVLVIDQVSRPTQN